MPLNSWSETITIAELADEPLFSEDMDALVDRIDDIRHEGDLRASVSVKVRYFVRKKPVGQRHNFGESDTWDSGGDER